jgi:hypothetical protein
VVRGRGRVFYYHTILDIARSGIGQFCPRESNSNTVHVVNAKQAVLPSTGYFMGFLGKNKKKVSRPSENSAHEEVKIIETL